MKKADFTLELIKDNHTLGRLAETLANKPAIALDIETTEWWNRQRGTYMRRQHFQAMKSLSKHFQLIKYLLESVVL